MAQSEALGQSEPMSLRVSLVRAGVDYASAGKMTPMQAVAFLTEYGRQERVAYRRARESASYSEDADEE